VSAAVVVLSPDELRAIVRDAVVEALAANTGASTDTLPLRACGVSIRTLRSAIASGELTAVKTGREFRVRRVDLDAWLATRTVEPKARAKTVPPADDPVSRALRTGALRVVKGRAA
jgi:excisionase family DNA binding protein